MSNVKQCTCQHAFQDRVYGKGMRVHTHSKTGEARCTVCGGQSRKMDRLRLHAKEWNLAFGLSPINPKLCTENRMVK